MKKLKLSALPEQQTTSFEIPLVQNFPIESLPNIKEEPTNQMPSVNSKSMPPVSNSNSNSAQLQEEKRQAVRKIIESIPTKKEDLFSYSLDWSLLDSVRRFFCTCSTQDYLFFCFPLKNLMEKRIKPWVIKKIVEYLGEEEPSLTDFICSSITSKKSADNILADIRIVLDDEADVFVVKMWRLLVYEIEAKRQGLGK